MPKTLQFIFSLAAAIAVSIPIAKAEPRYTASHPLKIGVIVPLSGDAASFGTALRNGITLALENVSAQDRARLEFLYENDELNSAKAVSALTKLVTQNKIEAVINMSSGTANALAPLVERYRIPMLAVASDPKVVQGRHFAFNFWVTPEEEARAMLAEAKRRGYRKIARITTIHEGAFSVRTAVDLQNLQGLRFVPDEEILPDVKDFKTFLAKVHAEPDLDALLPLVFPGQLSIIAKQARQLGIQLPLCGFEFFEDYEAVKNSEGALIGAWYVNAADPSGSFLNTYRQRFPQDSFYAAGNGYDMVGILAAVSREAGSTSDLASTILTLRDYTGVLGTYSSSGDGRFTLKAAVKVVTPSGFETIAR